MESVLLPLPQHQRPWQLGNPSASSPLSHTLKIPFQLRCSCKTTRARKWDSNAETVRTQSFDFRSRYDDNGDDDEEEEYDEGSGNWGKKRRWWSDESPDVNEMSSGGVLDDVIDSVRIFKVFRSFGWMLPAIILSFMLSTGPKAVLMALALPLGQSALSLAFDKLWGRTQTRPKRKARTRRKPFASTTVSDVELEEEEEEESQDTRKGQMGYQSWSGGNDGSVNKGGQNAPGFGGWDELDRAWSMRRPSRMAGGAQTTAEKGKLSRKGRRRSDTPLLLRLLIAVFPFLGSWTKML